MPDQNFIDAVAEWLMQTAATRFIPVRFRTVSPPHISLISSMLKSLALEVLLTSWPVALC